MRIGLLSDTHLPGERRTLWDEVRTAFQGVDLVLHGGDIVAPMVLDWLEEIAPVLAAAGNNDYGWRDPRMAPVQWLEVGGWRLAMIHDMEPEERPIADLCKSYLKGERADVIVTGHTHFERLDYREGVLQINPGSPTYPHLTSTRLGTVGILELDSGSLDARIVRLGETEGRRNPGVEYVFSLATGIQSLGDSAPQIERAMTRHAT
jgi:putative phosphoesterase